MSTVTDLLEHASSLLISSHNTLGEAHRITASIDVKQHRDLVDDHLGLRLVDLQARLDRLKKLVGEPRPLSDAEIDQRAGEIIDACGRRRT